MSSVRGWGSARFREIWQTPPKVFGRSQRYDTEEDLIWAAIERLPMYDRLRKGMLRKVADNGKVVDEVDVTKLGKQHKRQLMDSILKIRLDEKLGLIKKIAPVELQHHETFLPRAHNLKERANALLEMEVAAVGGKSAGIKAGRKASKKEKQHPVNISISRGSKKGKPTSPKVSFKMSRARPQRPQKVEPLDKEEGEMSDNEELLGRRIDQIVLEHEDELYRQDRMTMHLWNYVSTFSNLSGERLHQIYSKLK
ncbi:hypothetical protein REPUB_Repub13aG0023700 [Reevesia pubescens]